MDALNNFIQTAKELGNPAQQLRLFRQGDYCPQPKQLEFHAAARVCDEPGGPSQIGFGGARGPGKSHAVFAQLCMDDCQRFPGLKGLYLRKAGNRTREQVEDLRRDVLYATPHTYRRSDGVIEFPNGSRVILGHFKDEKDVDNYLGMQYDVIAIEEATTLTLTKYRTVRDSNRTSKDGWRPRIYTSTNPGGIGHAWYKATFIEPWRKEAEGDTRFIFATVADNVHIDPDYRKKLEDNTGWRLRAYRYGDWDIAAGQFFVTFRHDHHVVKPFAVPAAWKFWASLDYGYHHPTVVYLHAMDGDGIVYTIDEHYASGWQVADHVQALQEMAERWGMTTKDIHPWVAGHDIFAKKDDGPTIARKYRDLGIKWRPANVDRINGAAELLTRLGDVERDIEPTWFIFDTCPRLIECLPEMQHDPNRPEDVLKVDIDEDGNGGDDPYDAARYGLMVPKHKRTQGAHIDFYGTDQKRPSRLRPKRKSVQPDAKRSRAEVEDLLDGFDI